MEPGEARERFASGRVARLGTVTPDGSPHLVVVTFALDGDSIYTAVDQKPKRTRALKRLANIERNPHVALLTDHWDDADWSQLWWVRADGRAQVHESHPHALALLTERYEQYRDDPPAGPVIEVAVERWSGWSAAG